MKSLLRVSRLFVFGSGSYLGQMDSAYSAGIIWKCNRLKYNAVTETFMGYYIRVLGKNADNVPLETIEQAAKPARITMEEKDGDHWNVCVLSHGSGEDIAVIERNPVVEGQLGWDEIQEFLEEVLECKPESGAQWLREYLLNVKVIYAFQLLDGTDIHDGWSVLGRVKNVIWQIAGGIIQADGEGFSDEVGYTILWQFSNTVTGDWGVGVLSPEQEWLHYRMDLGDLAHREAFWNGGVPEGVELI
jgi:hypothetical protein